MYNFTPLSGAIGGALIGLSAVMLMLAAGRIAGISGIFGGLFAAADRGLAHRLPGRPGARAGRRDAGRVSSPGTGDAGKLGADRRRRPAGRLRHAARRRLHLGPRRLRHRPAVAALDRRDLRLHGGGVVTVAVMRHGSEADMPLMLAALRLRTRLRLGPLDLRHDAAGQGARLPRHLRPMGRDAGLRHGRRAGGGRCRASRWCAARPAPMFAAKSLWPTKTDIDTPLVAGAVMFGVGWGLVGLVSWSGAGESRDTIGAGDRVRHRDGGWDAVAGPVAEPARDHSGAQGVRVIGRLAALSLRRDGATGSYPPPGGGYGAKRRGAGPTLYNPSPLPQRLPARGRGARGRARLTKQRLADWVHYPRNPIIWPPSTTIVAPVMKRPASDASSSSAPSRSRSSPNRPTGISRVIAGARLLIR